MFKVRNSKADEMGKKVEFVEFAGYDHNLGMDNGMINYLLNLAAFYKSIPAEAEWRRKIHRDIYENFTTRLWEDYLNSAAQPVSAKKPFSLFENTDMVKFYNAYTYGTCNMIDGTARNPLKEAAWCLTHADIFNVSLKKRVIVDLVKGAGKTAGSIRMWNKYIDSMTDISDSMKVAFTILPDGTAPILACYQCDGDDRG